MVVGSSIRLRRYRSNRTHRSARLFSTTLLATLVIVPAIVSGGTASGSRGLEGGLPPAYGLYVYDSGDRYVLLYDSGAYTPPGGISPSQTWAFVHGAWAQLHPAHTPPDGFGRYMAYDSTDGYVILVGMHYSMQTWAFRGGDWSNLSSQAPTAPTIWGAGAIADDPADGYVVLFGTDNVHYSINQTWTYAHGQWTNRTGTGVTGIGKYGLMEWDPALGVVVFAQQRAAIEPAPSDPACNATWYYRAGHWSSGGILTPCQSSPGIMAYYPPAGEMILQGPAMGGSTCDVNPCTNSTWTFTSSGWKWRPFSGTPAAAWPFTLPSAMVYDSVDHEIVMYGGLVQDVAAGGVAFSSSTWVYSNGTWTELASPPAPSSAPWTGWEPILIGVLVAAAVVIVGAGLFLRRRARRRPPRPAPSVSAGGKARPPLP